MKTLLVMTIFCLVLVPAFRTVFERLVTGFTILFAAAIGFGFLFFLVQL